MSVLDIEKDVKMVDDVEEHAEECDNCGVHFPYGADKCPRCGSSYGLDEMESREGTAEERIDEFAKELNLGGRISN